MESRYLTPFSKATLTGLFAGIMATLLCLAYNIFFRESSGFLPADYINVSSLIFAVNLVFLVMGMLYYGFIKLFRRGDIVFAIVFIAITVVLAILSASTHRFNVPVLNTEFHELIIPIILIMGLLGAIGIPYLYHSKKFEEHVL